MLKPERNSNIWIFLIFFMGTLSYVSTLGLTNIKYIAITITILIVFTRIYSEGWDVARENGTVWLGLLGILALSACLQDTTFNQKLFSFFFYVVLLSWALFGNYILNKEGVLHAGLGIAAGVAIGLGSSVDMIVSQLNSMNNPRNRLWGGFAHPNHLGAIAAAGIMALCCYIFLDKSKKHCVIKIIIGLLLPVLYMTKSRTSWITFIVFLGVYLLHNIDKLSTRAKWLAYFAAALCTTFVAYIFWTEYAMQTESFVGRLTIFKSMTVTPKNFFVGNGMVNASSLNYADTNGGTMEIAWVTLFYKNGIIGIIAYVVLFAMLIRRANKVADKNQRWLFYSLLASFLVGSIGEAFLCNITNLSPMLDWILLSALSENDFSKTGVVLT